MSKSMIQRLFSTVSNEIKQEEVIRKNVNRGNLSYKVDSEDTSCDDKDMEDNSGQAIFDDFNEYKVNSDKLDEILNRAGNYFYGNVEEDKDKYYIVKTMQTIERFYKRKLFDHTLEEKERLVETLKDIYNECNNLHIMITISEFQSRNNMDKNIIKDEINKFADEPNAWKLYGNIEKYNFKTKKKAIDRENFKDALVSAKDKYHKALNLNGEDYKILHSLGECNKMEENNEKLYLEEAEKLYMKSLEIIERTQNKDELNRNKMINFQGVAEVYRRKVETYNKKTDIKEVEECIDKINYCYDTIESFPNAEIIQDNRYYVERNKAYIDIAMYYKINRQNDMSKVYFETIIQSYDEYDNLYNLADMEVICKSFINKGIILMYEGKVVEAYENFEMPLSLTKAKKNIKPKTIELLKKNCEKFDFHAKREEGVIDSISPNGNAVIIHCKSCNNLHYAHISSFAKSYSLNDLEEMKRNRTKLIYTPLRIFKYPLHTECIRNAYDVVVTNESIKEDYDKNIICYPEKCREEENEAKYKFELVERDYIGRFEYFDFKSGNGMISNLIDKREVKVRLGQQDELEENMKRLKYRLSLYGTCKSFVRFDLYNQIDDMGNSKFIAKNIDILFGCNATNTNSIGDNIKR